MLDPVLNPQAESEFAAANVDGWEDRLADHPLLGGLVAEDLATLTPHLTSICFEPGAQVVAQHGVDRCMYFVLRGDARARRDGLDIGLIRCGEHFGELGLILGTPRAASVVAVTLLEVAQLSQETYRHLQHVHPELVMRLLEALVGGVAHRLEAMTDSVGLLLRERSLPRRAEVVVQSPPGAKQIVRTGTPVGHLLAAQVDGHAVVAGLVDHHVVPLSYPISSQCLVEPVTAAVPEGQLVIRQSAALLLLEAAFQFDPNLIIELGASLGFGRRVLLGGATTEGSPSQWHGKAGRLAQELSKKIELLRASSVHCREELWTLEEAREYFAEHNWQGAVALLKTWHHRAVHMVSYGELYALSLQPVLPDPSILHGIHVIGHGNDLILVYPTDPVLGGSASEQHPDIADFPQADLLDPRGRTLVRTTPQELWLRNLDVRSVGAFNQACIDGDVSQLIRVSEGFQEKQIIEIAGQIIASRGDIKFVCIAGPSSSGKTTFIKRLNVQLQVGGMHPAGISLDDYYCDRELTPRDANGDFDFESFDALRHDLLAAHLQRLAAGELVETAHYDFVKGLSAATGGPRIRLNEGDLLLLEGLHGLNPGLLGTVDERHVFTVFVSPITTLPFDRLSRVSASDVRLLRRIVRDRHARNHDAASSILRWPSVRRGERQHIFPYQQRATAVFDSALPYELSVIKVFAQRYLLEVPNSSPAYPTASRLLGLLDRFITIYPDHVPPTSILREFFGASGFEY